MLCLVADCQKLASKKGYCNAHYIKKRRYGDPLIKIQRDKGAVSKIEILEAHALVELTKGQWAIIDLADVEIVSKYSWCFLSNGYAYSHQANLLLHQLIIGKAPKGYQCYHINRQKLDCRRENLRHVTYFENVVNSDINDASDLCSWDAVRKKWKATFRRNGKTIYSGYFKNKEDATKASRAALLRLNEGED